MTTHHEHTVLYTNYLYLFTSGDRRKQEFFRSLLDPLIQDQLRVNKNDAEQVIKQNLGDRKLIVLVDDLDRASPELLPHLLLGLRETLDLQQCAFVMGLDPVIVSTILSEVHAGWGKTPEFLEKIIDFHFGYLPFRTMISVVCWTKNSDLLLSILIDMH